MSRRTPRVLVIEDNSHDARLIEIMFASARDVEFEVAKVERLSAARAWLQENDPDVVLLDLSLPDSHGLETFEALYGARPDVPIVVLSGLQDEELALKAVQAGAQDYLVKSQDSDDAMLRAVRYAIERFRGSRNLRQRDEHLRLLTEQLPCVFWTTDTHLRLTSNSGGDLFAGSPGAVLEGKHISEVLRADEFDTDILRLHEQAVRGNSQTLHVYRQNQVYHVHIEPFRQRDGRTIGTIGVALDVTDQKLVDLELQVTRQIQAGLRPKSAPRLNGFDLAGASFSAAEAGGDYFDYFQVCDGSTAVVVADVAGHGLGPAMMMCHTRAYVRALAVHYPDPSAILQQVNRFLCGDSGEERLVALFLAKLDARGSQMQYANAGHRGYYFRPDAVPELLKPTAIPLNVLEDYQLEPTPAVHLSAGDLVLLYTDGVIECTSTEGEAFGQERMLELVAASSRKPAQAIIDDLFAEVCAFAPQLRVEDDMTAVVIKRV